MSKSLGNSPDPLDLISKFGADGLRFGIMNIAPKGQDILFSEERISVGRNFCNKLWNACRFRQMTGDPADNSSLEAITERLHATKFDEYDHWILARMLNAMEAVERCFATYEFNQMTQVIYALFWSDYCDWYLEVSKIKMQSPETRANCLAIQDIVIRQVLQLLGPVTPHIAEELWQRLGYGSRSAGEGDIDATGDFLQDSPLESSKGLRECLRGAGIGPDPAVVGHIENLQELVSSGRALKAGYNLASKRDVAFAITAAERDRGLIESHIETIQRLMGAANLAFCAEDPGNSPAAVTALGTLYLDLSTAVDREAEKARLDKQITGLNTAIATGESKLGNENFVARAPAAVVAGVRDQLAASIARRSELERLRDGLAGAGDL
jgi:valyl-tRNA synthetase